MARPAMLHPARNGQVRLCGAIAAQWDRAASVLSARPPRVGLYSRVSTSDQTPENQLAVLRAFAEARGWTTSEFHRPRGEWSAGDAPGFGRAPYRRSRQTD